MLRISYSPWRSLSGQRNAALKWAMALPLSLSGMRSAALPWAMTLPLTTSDYRSFSRTPGLHAWTLADTSVCFARSIEHQTPEPSRNNVLAAMPLCQTPDIRYACNLLCSSIGAGDRCATCLGNIGNVALLPSCLGPSVGPIGNLRSQCYRQRQVTGISVKFYKTCVNWRCQYCPCKPKVR